jgi:peptidoglycan hydrolase-like protein with peptidoglycan-binding domain
MRFKKGQRVSFRWSRGALATKLTKDRTGWTVRVPAGTAIGTISVTVANGAGRRSAPVKIRVIAKAVEKVSTIAPADAAGLPDAFEGDGQWIWYIDKSEGGDLDAIAARAKAAGMSTVFVKSADGTTVWKQFTPALVAGLKARGLRVCGWQFVYGENPTGEAAAAAASVKAGADCFVIDAETQYEGRYAAAQTYVAALRAAIGPTYPVGLTSFPYVDYHPRLPYSVFLGPGGAQVNLPQVYWKDIGASVDAVSAKTLANNRIYGAPIAPLGQTYGSPSAADLRRFRAIWAGYGSKGLSWWSWQATPDSAWTTLTEARPATVTLDDPGWPGLEKGASGDQVAWLQQHLKSFTPSLKIDAKFTAATETSLQAFQSSKGLSATGETDAATWQAVLTLPVVAADWR